MSRLTPSALKLPDFRGESKQARQHKHDGEGSTEVTPSRNTDSNPRGLRSMSGLLGGLGRRKDQDLAATLDENRYLHEKFESAKEDFQAQTSGLMRELSKVYGEKDELEKERDDLRSQLSFVSPSVSMSSLLMPSWSGAMPLVPKEACSAESPSTTDCCIGNVTELERLKAETIVLSRALAVSRGETTLGPQRCSGAIPDGREASLSSLIDQQLETGLVHLRGHVDADPGDVEVSPLPPVWTTSKQSMADALLNCLARFALPGRGEESAELCDMQRHNALPPDVELEVSMEERNLLQTKLHTMATEHGESLRRAQEDAGKWRQKAQGKQATLVKVQAEQEGMYSQLKEASSRVGELQTECEQLRGEVSYMESRLQTRNDGAAQVLDGLREEIVDLHEQLSEAKRSECRDAAVLDSGVSGEKAACMENELINMCAERSSLLAKVVSVEQIALRRKALADDLAIENQDLAGQLANQMRLGKVALEEKDAEISALQRTVEELQYIREAASSMERIQEELGAAQELCASLKQKLEEKDNIHNVKVDTLQESLTTAKKHCGDLSTEVEAARERVAEAEAKVLIADRKASATLKDMKHQLTMESKRVTRLQQELQAVQAEQEEAAAAAACLSADANGPSLARMPVQMVKRMTSLSTAKLEELLSSLGNLSAVDNVSNTRKRSSSDAATSLTSTSSLAGSDTAMQPCPAPRENTRYLYKSFSELEAIIHGLRAEKLALEERVHHLEENASGMAEELLEKSAVIRSCVGQDAASNTAKRSSLSILSPALPANLFRRFTAIGDGGGPTADSHASREGTENGLLRRRVEEGIIKITHLEQTVRDLMAEREILQTERHDLLQCVTASNQ